MAEANGNENKGGNTPTAEQLAAQVEALKKENSTLLQETLSKKEQLKALETQKQEQEAAVLKEQNKYKELYEGALAKAKRADELEPVLNQILESEIALVPEDKRDLIPSFEKPEQKLSWLNNAKTKGLFGTAKDSGSTTEGDKGKGKDDKSKNPPGSVQSKTGGNSQSPEFLSFAPNDPRLAKLSTAEYVQWKQHNRKPASGVVGWGGQG